MICKYQVGRRYCC
uniref:Uncharacterized protein n=1 Tax=Rhizophora mucronata TaxID=61149 RepID=A0A2P2N982_RHIMU